MERSDNMPYLNLSEFRDDGLTGLRTSWSRTTPRSIFFIINIIYIIILPRIKLIKNFYFVLKKCGNNFITIPLFGSK